MKNLLRKLAEWKGRCKSAQVIVFDGGAEVERARAFFKGALTGIGLALGIFLLAAPHATDPVLVQEVNRQKELLEETQQRLHQSLQVAQVCLNTAQRLEKTLSTYQSYLAEPSGRDVHGGSLFTN